MDAERFDTVVIGGGQAGLATGYHLQRAGHRFVILDAYDRVGEEWRRRWDSLRLFTQARYCALPGMPFPGDPFRCPTKDEMADYLACYAEQLSLPVRTGARVERLASNGGGFTVTVDGDTIEADRVVIATGAHRDPRIPAFAHDLDPSIVQLHSREYRHPSQLREGGVLIVGAGNSGADIALDVIGTHPTWISGRHPGHIPPDIDTSVARHIVYPIIRAVGLHVLTTRTPIGRRAIEKMKSKGMMLVRVKPKWLARAGVERVPRTVRAQGGLPVLEDGRVLDVTNVIWCTGFRQDLTWIDLPVFGEDGELRHERGVAAGADGLYFVGLPYQYSVASDNLVGVARDAAWIVERLTADARRAVSFAAA
jgi:putative flavoprotein involved in K+ transport